MFFVLLHACVCSIIVNNSCVASVSYSLYCVCIVHTNNKRYNNNSTLSLSLSLMMHPHTHTHTHTHTPILFARVWRSSSAANVTANKTQKPKTVPPKSLYATTAAIWSTPSARKKTTAHIMCGSAGFVAVLRCGFGAYGRMRMAPMGVVMMCHDVSLCCCCMCVCVCCLFVVDRRWWCCCCIVVLLLLFMVLLLCYLSSTIHSHVLTYIHTFVVVFVASSSYYDFNLMIANE